MRPLFLRGSRGDTALHIFWSESSVQSQGSYPLLSMEVHRPLLDLHSCSSRSLFVYMHVFLKGGQLALSMQSEIAS